MLDLISLGLPALHVLAQSGSSDEGGGSFGFLLLLSGPIFYGAMYMRYRNSDKRHHHESETEATMLELRQADERVGSIKGVPQLDDEWREPHRSAWGLGQGEMTHTRRW